METKLADLLLDPASASAEERLHMEACSDCRRELAELQMTMHVLDGWAAPEPSPFFDTKLRARLRAEKWAAPAGFLERLRTRWLFSSNVHLRPVAAGVLATVLAVSGGTVAWLEHNSASRVQQSATVRDLQSLDGNAQVFQQLSLLDGDADDGGSAAN
jgi:anti-sigma factor RsiW